MATLLKSSAHPLFGNTSGVEFLLELWEKIGGDRRFSITEKRLVSSAPTGSSQNSLGAHYPRKLHTELWHIKVYFRGKCNAVFSQLMAVTVTCCWALALSACLVLTVRAECDRDCALCLYRLLRTDTDADTDTPACTLECEGTVDSRKIEICKNIITEEDRYSIDNLKQEQPQATEHLQAKKYGGFMKRYGGFMVKKAAETGTGAQENQVISKKYGGFMKKDKAEVGAEDKNVELLKEILRLSLDSESEEQTDGEISKRYGGFMRSVQEKDTGRDLHKRYGGFMRRVGRPDWLDNQKNNELLKRTWEDGSETALPGLQKRYGGFLE
ncbi:hypothetical protein DNTS_007102 [Danionella cerebrum]|uniref:Uncharacterized protein n=1 Tax=Danionella cerebrum TaxID=2873325 RepID=A0A553QCA3_9TELE|nr:hypothetical protein DNTS_007102 [Danionella translucida]